jgi:sulfate adenylyltransferase subunit 2
MSVALDSLADEAVTIIREVTAECDAPVLLFSGGKDSAVLLHLAALAFRPGRIPFPVMHVDTGHNFPEAIAYRDDFVASVGARLVVASVEESIRLGRVVEEGGPRPSRNRLQSVTLLDAIAAHRFDAAFGGGRRDEDKARAKERILSFRDREGRWEPRHQRPEPWNVLNARIRKGEHLRAFPLSNWTELDIWRFVKEEDIPLPSIYFSHRRTVVERDGMLLAVGGPVVPEPGEEPVEETVRYRTVGDMSCTGAVRSTAATVDEVIEEVAAARITERGATRADDTFSEAAMEDRKREGYF